MSTALRTKLRSLPTTHLRRNIRYFSSIDDGEGHSGYPSEPVPDRPLRKHSNASRSPRFPNSNRGRRDGNLNSSRGQTDWRDGNLNSSMGQTDRRDGNLNSSRGQTDADFLERFKLGLDSEAGNPKSDVEDKPQSENVGSVSPTEDANEIFKKMKETGLIPNAVAMLDGLCKDGLVQDALKLFGVMREKGAIPEVVVYTAVVEGFCKASKFDDAMRIFRKMQSNGMAPNAFSYQVLVRGLCGGKRLEEAYEFVIEMLEAGHSPNLATFAGLIDVYCREKGLEEAKNVISGMKVKGFSLEEKQIREYLDRKGPFLPLVWEAILGKKASKSSLF